MQLTNAKRMQLALANSLTTLAVLISLVLAAWLSTRYHWQLDWTASARNTLSKASAEVLQAMPSSLRIEVFARQDRIEGRVLGELLRRYLQHKPEIQVTYTNPDLDPERLRALGIGRSGALRVEYESRQRIIEQPSERTITSALLQLRKDKARLVAYLVDHGERKLDGKANHDLGRFGELLRTKGFKFQALSLAQAGAIPVNTDVLLIAGPRVALQSGESELIESFVDTGGSLIWLIDPGPMYGLDKLSKKLGVGLVAGTIVDPATQRFTQAGLGNPTNALITRYAKHPALAGFNILTILPGAAGLQTYPPDASTGADKAPAAELSNAFKVTEILRTSDDVWSESAELRGTITFDQLTDSAGPFAVGLALTRQIADREQRIVVVGDGDFLSNAALGNSGNLDLGLRLFTWLARDDVLIDIPARTDPDSTLTLSPTMSGVIGLTALIGLPLLLCGCGIAVWLRRRHH
jgi:hypothetical protein